MKVICVDGDTADTVYEKLHTMERAFRDNHYADTGVVWSGTVGLCVEMTPCQYGDFVNSVRGTAQEHAVVTERTFLGIPIYIRKPTQGAAR